jgi:hypothetical protein
MAHAWKVWRNSSVSGAIKRWRNSRTLARSNYFWISFPIEHLLMLIDCTGISVGEIGPKLCFNITVNNGNLGFDKVRIPRDHLLMKIILQNNLFPPLAATFWLHFVANYVWDLYNSAREGIGKGDLHLMPDVCFYRFSCRNNFNLSIA